MFAAKCSQLGSNDDKVLIGGNFYYDNSTIINNAARFSTNGTLDATFNAGGGGAPYDVYAIGLQSNGQLILGLQYGNNLERLNTDGSVDSNFLAIVTGGTVYSVAVLTNDMLVIGGDFISINGYSRQGIARLSMRTGDVDNTFRPGTGTNNTVRCVAVQPDGKVLLAGYFSIFNGVTRKGIVRLQADGTVDSGFNPGSGVNTPDAYPILCLTRQSDGKALIAGNFTQLNGTNINRIARLNSDTSSTTLNLLSPQIYFGMNLSGVVSNTYRIEYTSKFNTPSLWTPLFNVLLQTNPQFILDTNPASGQCFYRAVQVSP